MNIAEFVKTINIKDAVLMSASSWDKVKDLLLLSPASPQQEVKSDDISAGS